MYYNSWYCLISYRNKWKSKSVWTRMVMIRANVSFTWIITTPANASGWVGVLFSALPITYLTISWYRGEPGEVGHQMSRFTHSLRQTLFINLSLCRKYSFVVWSNLYSDAHFRNDCMFSYEAKTCIAKREKWDSVGRSGKNMGRNGT